MSLNKVILFGYSGHSLVVNDCLGHNRIFGYFDNEEKNENPLDIKYLGVETEEDLSQFDNGVFVFPSIGNNILRKKIRSHYLSFNMKETNAIHPSAVISRSVKLGLGTMIGPNAVLNAKATIKNGVIVNSGVIIEHECTIHDYVHLAPGVVLAGNVTVEELSFIGANTVIKEGVKIGKNVIVGAGSVVLNDIPDNEMWFGLPAIKKKTLEK
tara:strand:+ start:5237 stop:5869 length:633 start_codon:yes stop_codon:yes gene_type:complete